MPPPTGQPERCIVPPMSPNATGPEPRRKGVFRVRRDTRRQLGAIAALPFLMVAMMLALAARGRSSSDAGT